MNIKRKATKLTALILSITLLAATPVAAAEDTDFEGWDETTKEDAWSVYTTTDWRPFIKDLNIETANSSTGTVNISSKTAKLKDTVKDVLEKTDESVGIFKNVEYTDLMLCMIEELSGGNPSKDDPANVLRYITPNADPDKMNERKSIRTLFRRFADCETSHDGEINIYQNNESLQSCIQGVVFGTSYTRKNKNYSRENAVKFMEKYPDKLKGDPSAGFAADAAAHYKTVMVGQAYEGQGDTEVAKKIVEAAYSQLGVPYVWGGTTPGVGLDCSGFTQYCHRMAGISIPRTSGPQGAGGKQVSDPRPGDICYHQGHVGIYIGNGLRIHAPHTGDVVKIAPVPAGDRFTRYW